MTIWDNWKKDPRYDQVEKDPRYLKATPQYMSNTHDILSRYGIGVGEKGLNDPVGGHVAYDPYSVASLLKKAQTTANQGTFNAANEAGLEESGAAVGGVNANTQNYNRGLSEATYRQGMELQGNTRGYVDTVDNVFADTELNPVVPAVQGLAAAVGPVPGQATGMGTAFPTPQIPYQRTGPEAGWSVASKVKKINPGFAGRAL